jgi:hypothetical protein
MVKDRANRLRRCHLQLFAVVLADQDRVFVTDVLRTIP